MLVSRDVATVIGQLVLRQPYPFTFGLANLALVVTVRVRVRVRVRFKVKVRVRVRVRVRVTRKNHFSSLQTQFLKSVSFLRWCWHHLTRNSFWNSVIRLEYRTRLQEMGQLGLESKLGLGLGSNVVVPWHYPELLAIVAHRVFAAAKLPASPT